jgi:hypothetical protein
MGYPHTPGPWCYESGLVTSDRGTVAYMDRENPKTRPVERDSNARLIAACPNLEALAERVDEEWHLAHDAMKRGDRAEVFRFLNEWQDEARAALKLARGE